MDALSTDGGQGQPGEQTLATPAFQEVPVVATSSEKTFDEDALVSKIVDRLAPEIEKRVQSTKDKRFAGLDKLGGVDELLKLKDHIKAQGGDVDKGLREYQIDQLLNQTPTGSPAPAASRPVVDQASVQKRTAEILTDAGIAFDDPEYVALAGKPHANPDAFYHEVGRFAIRRAKQSFTPGAATVSAGGGGVPASGNQNDKLNRLYGDLAEAQKSSNEPERARLTKEIKALGGIA